MIARVTIYIFLVPVSRYFLPVACDTVLVLIAIKYVYYQNCTTTILQRTGTVPDTANQHLSELQIRPTSNSSKSTTTTQKLKSFCKRLYLMVV